MKSAFPRLWVTCCELPVCVDPWENGSESGSDLQVESWTALELHHQPGRSMGKPDTLSWRADHPQGTNNNSNIMLLTPEKFHIQASQTPTGALLSTPKPVHESESLWVTCENDPWETDQTQTQIYFPTDPRVRVTCSRWLRVVGKLTSSSSSSFNLIIILLTCPPCSLPASPAPWGPWGWSSRCLTLSVGACNLNYAKLNTGYGEKQQILKNSQFFQLLNGRKNSRNCRKSEKILLNASRLGEHESENKIQIAALQPEI